MTIQEKFGLLMIVASLSAMGRVQHVMVLLVICIVFMVGWYLFWFGGKKDDFTN